MEFIALGFFGGFAVIAIGLSVLALLTVPVVALVVALKRD